MKKTGFLVSFILEGTLTVFLISQNLSLVCVVHLKEMNIISENLKNSYIHMIQP